MVPAEQIHINLLYSNFICASFSFFPQHTNTSYHKPQKSRQTPFIKYCSSVPLQSKTDIKLDHTHIHQTFEHQKTTKNKKKLGQRDCLPALWKCNFLSLKQVLQHLSRPLLTAYQACTRSNFFCTEGDCELP